MAQGFRLGAAALHMASGGAFGFRPVLKNGGDLQTGKGGHVPGTGSGDKIPAKYEPGEFVVSNDMMEANPGMREQLHAVREKVLAAQGTTPAKADAKNAGVIAKLAAKSSADQPSLGFAAGGAIDDEARKRNSFGDGAAAMSNAGVSQVPTGFPKVGPIASLGAATPASPAAPLAQGPIAGLNSRSVSSAIAPGSGQGITGNSFGDASAATSNPAVQQPTVGGGLIRYATNYGPAGLNPTARVEGSTSVPTPGDSAEPVAPGLGFGKLSTPPGPPESMAGAGRGIAPDPRSLGNPGTIANQAKGLSAAPPVATPGPIASLNNPKALNNVVGSEVNGAPGVVKLQGGMFKNPMYTDDPVRAANQFNQIGLVPGASTGTPASGTASGSSSAPKLGFGASASTDAALSAARFAAADRGDFNAIRDTYNAHGQSFAGETKESVAADRLKELALSPRGTPGRRAAMQMMTENTAAQTARYTADSQVRSQQAANGIAQRRLGLEEQKAAADDAQKVRVAQLDDLIMNGNPLQQKRAAGQKAALLGKGMDTVSKAPAGYRETADGGLEFIKGGPADPAVKVGSGKPMPTSAAKGLLDNMTGLKQAEKALGLLNGESIDGVAGDANAVGMKGYVPNALLNRLDSEGVATRSLIADIGSLKIHDRSGAAVTASEFPRLAPFIPTATDDPKTARTKLNMFVKNYQSIIDETRAFYEESGYKVPGAKVESGPTTQDAYAQLPSGAEYTAGDGSIRRKK